MGFPYFFVCKNPRGVWSSEGSDGSDPLASSADVLSTALLVAWPPDASGADGTGMLGPD